MLIVLTYWGNIRNDIFSSSSSCNMREISDTIIVCSGIPLSSRLNRLHTMACGKMKMAKTMVQIKLRPPVMVLMELWQKLLIWRPLKHSPSSRVSPIKLIHGMSRKVDREEANLTWQTLNGTVGNDNCLFKPISGILSRSLSPSWFSQYRLEGGIIFENKNGFLFSRTQLVGESKNNENENAFLFFVFALPIGPTLGTE